MESSRQDMELILEGLVSIASKSLQQINLQESFNVIKELGHGGYGSVLMVKDKKTEQKMAIKLLNKRKTTEFRFLMEFSVSFFLSSHPNIIGVHGAAFKTGDFFAFTQELSLHGDLFSLIPPHDGLPEDTVKRCAVQVSSALDFIDSKGLVHLDIKPENILVFDKDCHCIKITDFGLSKCKGTITKTKSGTSTYMAPEMIEVTDKDPLLIDSPLDVWSFGILLYFLLTSDFPWQSAVSKDKHYSSFAEWQNNMEIIEPPSPWNRLPTGVLKMFHGLLSIDYNRRSRSTVVLMFLDECWKKQLLEKNKGTLDDADAQKKYLSKESGLLNHYQESYCGKDVSARTQSDMSCHVSSDTSEDEEPSEYQKDNVYNLSMFMDHDISPFVEAEVEIG